MTRLYCDGPTLIRAVESAIANLEHHVEEVDALNVFPVPDGDTGSNMLATMRAALTEAQALSDDERDLAGVADALTRGALTGARGNSGVILSQIIRGMTDHANGRRRASGLDLARGLRNGSDVAYGSVLTPVEGTILTVIRDAADAAETAAGRQPHVESVLADTIEAAARSVQRTPTLLPVLDDAGVVDSGGQGLFRLLEGTMQVADPARPSSSRAAAPVAPSQPPYQAAFVPPSGAEASGGATQAGEARPMIAPEQSAPSDHVHDGEEGAHGYETEYLLTAGDQPLDPDAIRASLQAIGDSIIVAGGEDLARVHVHGQRPDLAIAVGLQWGRLSAVQIIDLDGQVAAQGDEPAATVVTAVDPTPAVDTAIVAVADSDGLAATLEGLGARVIRPAHGSRPSVGEIAGGILAVGATEVIVLPNDRDAHLAAGQAASLTPGVSVSIIPTRNVAEGIAAALVFDQSTPMERNATRMESESGAVRSFTVTTAARDSVVDGSEVHEGQLIALDADRRLLAADSTVEAVTVAALSSLGAFELVTFYHGRGIKTEGVERIAQQVEELGLGSADELETEVVLGDQLHDHLLVAVE